MLFLCDVIQNKVIRKENFPWLDVFFGRPELFEQVKCLNNLNVENGTGVYLIQVKEKRKSRSQKVGVFNTLLTFLSEISPNSLTWLF